MSEAPDDGRWSVERAARWRDTCPWLVGCNFLPSTAVNDTEMWQGETFDPATIDRELGWAHGLGFNSCRIFLQYIVYEADPEGFLRRFDDFLSLADGNGLSVMPILFDDCAFAGKAPYRGRQADPVPGVHNSGWVPSPAPAAVTDREQWLTLQAYVQTVVGHHADDPRVVVWDLYNEPGASGMGDASLPLVEATFGWAREMGPTQPLTVGSWTDSPMNERVWALSDVISFHDYGDLDRMRTSVDGLRCYDRPILCTEWMARTQGSRLGSHLPYLKAEGVAAYSWGLVAGRTQTYYPWGSQPGTPEPEVWFHDILRPDGTPFDAREAQAIGQAASR
jgi:hypothetical protein